MLVIKKEILECGPVDANGLPFLMEEASSDSSNHVRHFMTLIRTVNWSRILEKQPLQQITPPPKSAIPVCYLTTAMKKNGKRKEKECIIRRRTINHPVSKHKHITSGANALTLQSMLTFDIIKQFQQCWQVSTNQGNLISVAFQS